MEESNLLCDQSACSNPAVVFGFLSPDLKTKACQDHYLVLVHKQVPSFPISTYAFIDSIQAVSLYEQRKTLMEKGLSASCIVAVKRSGTVGRLRFEPIAWS